MIDNNKSLLNLEENDYEINMIIDQLIDDIKDTTVYPNDCCVGAAIDTGIDFLTIYYRDDTNTKRYKGGGRILSFQCNTCNQGPGQVARKFERKWILTHNAPENETEYKKFLSPDSKDSFWFSRASKCAEGGIRCDTYLFSTKEDTDISTQLITSKWTGGEFNLFNLKFDSEHLHNKIYRCFSNTYVGDVAFKVRTSKELYVSN